MASNLMNETVNLIIDLKIVIQNWTEDVQKQPANYLGLRTCVALCYFAFFFPKVILEIVTLAQTLRQTGVKVMKGWTTEEWTCQGCGGLLQKHLNHDTVKRATVIPHCSHLLIVLTGRWRCINHFLFRWVHRVHCRVGAVAYLSYRFVPGRIPTILHSSFQWLIKGVQVLPVLTPFHCKSQQTELHLLPVLRQTLDYDVNNVASKVFVLLQAAMLWKC